MDTLTRPEMTLREHLSAAGKAAQAKRTPDERKAHAKMMLKKRWPNGAKAKHTIKESQINPIS